MGFDVRKLTSAALLATAAPFALACPAPAHAQIMDLAGKPLSPEEARRLNAKIESLGRRLDIREAALSSIARAVGENLGSVSFATLISRIEQTAQEASLLSRRVRELEEEVSGLPDSKVRDAAIAKIEEARLAFDDGRFAEAEERLGELVVLKASDAQEAREAWYSAIRSQADMAALQQGVEDFDRADALLEQLAEAQSADRKELRLAELRTHLERGDRRRYEGINFGRRRPLDLAIEIFERDALPLADRAQDAEMWLETMLRLADTQRAQAERLNGEISANLFDAAAENYADILESPILADDPDRLGRAQHGQAVLLLRRAERSANTDAVRFFSRAQEAMRSALSEYEKSGGKAQYLEAALELASIKVAKSAILPFPSNVELLDSAIADYQNALTKLTGENQQSLKATGQTRLGQALARRAKFARGKAEFELMKQAEAAYLEALENLDRDTSPIAYAAAANGLGLIASRRGDDNRLLRREEYLEQAMRLFGEAVETFSIRETPMLWATAKRNHGLANVAFLRLSKDREPQVQEAFAKAAVSDLMAAGKVYSAKDSPAHWGSLNLKLAEALLLQAGFESGDTRIQSRVNSANAAHEAMAVFDKDVFPEEWAQGALRRAEAFIDLSDEESLPLNERHAVIVEAGRLAKTAADIFRERQLVVLEVLASLRARIAELKHRLIDHYASQENASKPGIPSQ